MVQVYKKGEINDAVIPRGSGEVEKFREQIRAEVLPKDGDCALLWDIVKFLVPKGQDAQRKMSVRLRGGLTEKQGFKIWKDPKSGRTFVERIAKVVEAVKTPKPSEKPSGEKVPTVESAPVKA
jgi:hypothetical protein